MALSRLLPNAVVVLACLCVCGTSLADEVYPGVFRTPTARFADLPGYDFKPNYRVIQGYRVHYLDEGPSDGDVVLLLHGEPSWSYLYRKMIPVFTAAGYRVIAPDLVGFGKSDKPALRSDHSYPFHVAVVTELIEKLKLADISAFFQDWGGLIGLRVLTENPERFARVAIGNTTLPVGQLPDGAILGQEFTEFDSDARLEKEDGFEAWLRYSQVTPELYASYILQYGTVQELPADIMAAYDAPFPDARYKAGPRVMPTLVASQHQTNLLRWQVLATWQKPFLTTFSDSDPVLGEAYGIFQENVPGALGQPHITVEQAGHFLQEDKGEELATYLVQWYRQTQ